MTPIPLKLFKSQKIVDKQSANYSKQLMKLKLFKTAFVAGFGWAWKQALFRGAEDLTETNQSAASPLQMFFLGVGEMLLTKSWGN